MTLRKSIRFENSRAVHMWTDDRVAFSAEARRVKDAWSAMVGNEPPRGFPTYLSAVDFIMDKWRECKAEELGLDVTPCDVREGMERKAAQ